MLESRKLSDYEKTKLSDFRQALLSKSLQSKMINFAMSLTKCNEATSKDLIQQTYLKGKQKQRFHPTQEFDVNASSQEQQSILHHRN